MRPTHVHVRARNTGPGNGSVARVETDGTGQPETVATGLRQPVGIAVDAVALYVAENVFPGRILRLAK